MISIVMEIAYRDDLPTRSIKADRIMKHANAVADKGRLKLAFNIAGKAIPLKIRNTDETYAPLIGKISGKIK